MLHEQQQTISMQNLVREFASEYAMFAPAQILCNLREQRPSNQGDLDSSVTGKVQRVYYTGVDLLLISFFVP
jgi:hypothetical protein